MVIGHQHVHALPAVAQAAPPPTPTYDIDWQVLSGGGATMSGGGYTLSGSIGQVATGLGTGPSGRLGSGFWFALGGMASRVYIPALFKA